MRHSLIVAHVCAASPPTYHHPPRRLLLVDSSRDTLLSQQVLHFHLPQPEVSGAIKPRNLKFGSHRRHLHVATDRRTINSHTCTVRTIHVPPARRVEHADQVFLLVSRLDALLRTHVAQLHTPPARPAAYVSPPPYITCVQPRRSRARRLPRRRTRRRRPVRECRLPFAVNRRKHRFTNSKIRLPPYCNLVCSCVDYMETEYCTTQVHTDSSCRRLSVFLLYTCRSSFFFLSMSSISHASIFNRNLPPWAHRVTTVVRNQVQFLNEQKEK